MQGIRFGKLGKPLRRHLEGAAHKRVAHAGDVGAPALKAQALHRLNVLPCMQQVLRQRADKGGGRGAHDVAPRVVQGVPAQRQRVTPPRFCHGRLKHGSPPRRRARGRRRFAYNR